MAKRKSKVVLLNYTGHNPLGLSLKNIYFKYANITSTKINTEA